MKKIILHSIVIATMLLSMQACRSGKTNDNVASSADSAATIGEELSKGPFEDFSTYYDHLLNVYEEELLKDNHQGLNTGWDRMQKEKNEKISDAIFLTTGLELTCHPDEALSDAETVKVSRIKRNRMGDIMIKFIARVKDKSKKVCLVLCDDKDQPIWVIFSTGTSRLSNGEYGRIFSLNLWIPTTLSRYNTQKGYAKLLAYATKARLVSYNEGKSLEERAEARAQDYYYKVSGKKSEVEENNKPKADLGAYELMGNVKSCKWTETEAQTNTYSFDEQGHLTKVNNRSVSKLYKSLKRDGEGRLLSYEQDHPDEFYSDGMTYTYDANSRMIKRKYVASDCEITSTYKYDTKGFVASVTDICDDMDDAPQKTTKTYHYEDVDSHGNWTKRSYTQDDGSKITEKRVITYY